MHQLASIRRNYWVTTDSEQPKPVVEIILSLIETEYTAFSERRATMTSCRFTCDADGCDMLTEYFARSGKALKATKIPADLFLAAAEVEVAATKKKSPKQKELRD